MQTQQYGDHLRHMHEVESETERALLDDAFDFISQADIGTSGNEDELMDFHLDADVVSQVIGPENLIGGHYRSGVGGLSGGDGWAEGNGDLNTMLGGVLQKMPCLSETQVYEDESDNMFRDMFQPSKFSGSQEDEYFSGESSIENNTSDKGSFKTSLSHTSQDNEIQSGSNVPAVSSLGGLVSHHQISHHNNNQLQQQQQQQMPASSLPPMLPFLGNIGNHDRERSASFDMGSLHEMNQAFHQPSRSSLDQPKYVKSRLSSRLNTSSTTEEYSTIFDDFGTKSTEIGNTSDQGGVVVKQETFCPNDWMSYGLSQPSSSSASQPSSSAPPGSAPIPTPLVLPQNSQQPSTQGGPNVHAASVIDSAMRLAPYTSGISASPVGSPSHSKLSGVRSRNISKSGNKPASSLPAHLLPSHATNKSPMAGASAASSPSAGGGTGGGGGGGGDIAVSSPPGSPYANQGGQGWSPFTDFRVDSPELPSIDKLKAQMGNGMQRTFSDGDLKHIRQWTPLLGPGGVVRSPLGTTTDPSQPGGDGVQMVGSYTLEERRDRIMRYRAKRAQRSFQRKIKYVCRKALAERRPRVRGRFVKYVRDGDTGSEACTEELNNEHIDTDDQTDDAESEYAMDSDNDTKDFMLRRNSLPVGRSSLFNTSTLGSELSAIDGF